MSAQVIGVNFVNPRWVCPRCGLRLLLSCVGTAEPMAEWEAELLHQDDCPTPPVRGTEEGA